MKWIVAFNMPTATWSSGGKVAEYPRPHWDLYQVEASTRDRAEAAAKLLRRKQRTLTPAQARLLASLLDEHDAAPPEERKAPPWVSIDEDERRAAEGLRDKGLIDIHEFGYEAMLLVSAFNRFEAVEQLRTAAKATA